MEIVRLYITPTLEVFLYNKEILFVSKRSGSAPIYKLSIKNAKALLLNVVAPELPIAGDFIYVGDALSTHFYKINAYYTLHYYLTFKDLCNLHYDKKEVHINIVTFPKRYLGVYLEDPVVDYVSLTQLSLEDCLSILGILKTHAP